VVRARADAAIAGAVAVCARRAPGQKSRTLAKVASADRPVVPRLLSIVEELGDRAHTLEARDRAALREAVTALGDTITAQLVQVLDVALGGEPTPTPPAAAALRRVA
jgi:hypothetical protein